MVYLFIVIILALMILMFKRKIGMAILVALTCSFVVSLWITDITIFLVNAKIGVSYEVIKSALEIVFILFPSLFALTRSSGTGKSTTGRVVEGAMYGILLAFLLRGSIGILLALDGQSIKFVQFLVKFEKIILSVITIYAVMDVLGKTSE